MEDNQQLQDFTDLLESVVLNNIPGCRKLVSAERLSGGASQETWRLVITTASGEQQLAMRRAAGGLHLEPEPQHPGLAVEALLMQAASAAGVPEPQIHYVLTQEDGLGDGFIMEWLEGETLGARIVRSPELAEARKTLALECGRILARIHQIDLDATGLRGKLWETSPREFVDQTWERYQLLNTSQPMIDYTARWLLDHLPAASAFTLVHNDFRNGNFMLAPSGVVAVLDWELAHIGDPMRDLGWICTNSWRFGGDKPVGGFGDKADLFRGYEEVSGRPVNPLDVKFWEVFGSFWWSVGCLGMAEHYRNGPDKTVERPAIGRRSSECQVDCVNLLIPGPVDVIVDENVGAKAVANSNAKVDLKSDQLVSVKSGVQVDAIPNVDSAEQGGGAMTGGNMPRTDELLTSVRDFLRHDVMAASTGRNNFLARVAANSLDIVLRELAAGQELERLEQERLAGLMNDGLFSAANLDAGPASQQAPGKHPPPRHNSADQDNLDTLRWWLVQGLRDGSIPLDNLALQQHLRHTVVNQVAVDQPKYSGYQRALALNNP